MTLQQIKEQLRNGKYAWPGGYPLYFVTIDGAALSFEAVRQEWHRVVYSYMHNLHDGWQIAGVDINYEDCWLLCDHTNKPIECAY